MDPLAARTVPAHPHEPLDVPALVRRTHDLLAAGVPLTLLLDLAEAAGPRSAQRYQSEGGDAGWLPHPRRG
jgi:hypothetical protein